MGRQDGRARQLRGHAKGRARELRRAVRSPSRESGGCRMSLRVVVFYGSVRADRQGIRAAHFMVERVSRAGARRHACRPARVPAAAARQDVQGVPPKGEAPEMLERLAADHPADALSWWCRASTTTRSRPRFEPARPLPRGVVLEAVGDRLLFGGRLRRRARRDAAAGDARRARHVEHPVDLPGAEGAGAPSAKTARRSIRPPAVARRSSSTSSSGTRGAARRAEQAVRAQRVHGAAGRAHGGLSGRR